MILNADPHRIELKKDPGVPNLSPLRDQLLLKKKRAAEAKQLQQEAREKAMNKNRRIISGHSTLSIKDIARQANARGQEFDASAVEAKADDGIRDVVDSVTVGGKDNSRKAYYREFRKVLEMADVILEVLDARDPLGCRTRQIERLIMDSAKDKRIILVLNKIGMSLILILDGMLVSSYRDNV